MDSGSGAPKCSPLNNLELVVPVEPRVERIERWNLLRFPYVSAPFDFDSKLSAGQFFVRGGITCDSTC